MINYQTVLAFWFAPETQKNWFAKSEAFDLEIKNQFGQTLEQAAQAELWTWRESIQGRLAEIIVLDQFSRNIYRDQPASFAQDPMALALAQEAIALGLDTELETSQRSFLYMPFMHSESKMIHQEALKHFESLGNPINLDFEIKHKAIIDRFGRYPHRNEILGRNSSAEEIAFLQQPNSRF